MNSLKLKRRYDNRIEAKYISQISNDKNLIDSFNTWKEDNDNKMTENKNFFKNNLEVDSNGK